jgi:hypothetical protein
LTPAAGGCWSGDNARWWTPRSGGWIEEYAIGGFDHLLLGTSLPVLLGPGMHHLQAWNEAVCSGVWGERATEWGEKIRRSQDLDHWSSFRDSFVRLTDLIRRVGAGEKGRSPASILVLSGDVHHGYLTQSTFRDYGVESSVYQVVCSPLRNSLPGDKYRLQRLAWTRAGEVVGRALSRLTGIRDPEIRWSLAHESLWFENQIASLELNGKQATLTFEKAVLDGSEEPSLEKIFEYRLV